MIKLDFENFKQGWTQSEMGLMDDCAYRWYLRYDRMLDANEANIKFAVGTAWHKIQQQIYSNPKSPSFEPPKCQYDGNPTLNSEREALLEQWDRILTVYGEEYIRHFKDDFASLQIEGVEEEISFKIEHMDMQIRVRGMIDLRAMMGKNHIVFDHKTCAGMNAALLRGWDFRFQFMFYIWLIQKFLERKVNRFIVNAMIKPTIRVKQTESLNGFCQRLRGEMRTTPAKYFYRQPLLLTEGKMDRFESNILVPKLNKIAMLQNPKTSQELLQVLLQPNTNSCMKFGEYCPYFDVCEKKIDPASLGKRKQKHTELYT